jgi:putative Holliday junction resolvase
MPELAKRPSGTVLAFDFGEKRIGVAVGEKLLAQAHPLTTIRGESNSERFAAIAALIAEWQPASLVVGLPVALDGSAHAMTARCTRFANQLRGRFGLPVDYAEERLTSVEAAEKLAEGGSKDKQHLDALAAQIILQCFFERTSESISDPFEPPTEDQAHAPHHHP